jgi:hypothetical protein
MRIFAHTAAVALLCALLSAPIHADPHKAVKAANRDKTSWLFIQTSHGATFDGKTLVLTRVDPAVVSSAIGLRASRSLSPSPIS